MRAWFSTWSAWICSRSCAGVGCLWAGTNAARSITSSSASEPRALAELSEGRFEPLAGCQHAGKQITVAADTVEHDVHRKARRIEPWLDFIPAQGRRDRRPG